ncbi:putative reverse transcriptase zinc-binding domain-containing protein [Helianthus annuus]|nr:putative reverse transcriptase zinc-binding domain-containing protein [Helianthus annuus]
MGWTYLSGLTSGFWITHWLQSSQCCRLWKVTNLCVWRTGFIRVQNGVVSLKFHWRQFCSAAKYRESAKLLAVLNVVSLSPGPDCWSWSPNASGLFSIKSIKALMQERKYTGSRNGFVWNSWSPLKVNFLLWRVFLGRLPTMVALRNRNIQVPSIKCSICGDDDEMIEHLFISCPLARQIRDAVSNWVRLNALFFY